MEKLQKTTKPKTFEQDITLYSIILIVLYSLVIFITPSQGYLALSIYSALLLLWVIADFDVYVWKREKNEIVSIKKIILKNYSFLISGVFLILLAVSALKLIGLVILFYGKISSQDFIGKNATSNGFFIDLFNLAVILIAFFFILKLFSKLAVKLPKILMSMGKNESAILYRIGKVLSLR